MKDIAKTQTTIKTAASKNIVPATPPEPTEAAARLPAFKREDVVTTGIRLILDSSQAEIDAYIDRLIADWKFWRKRPLTRAIPEKWPGMPPMLDGRPSAHVQRVFDRLHAFVLGDYKTRHDRSYRWKMWRTDAPWLSTDHRHRVRRGRFAFEIYSDVVFCGLHFVTADRPGHIDLLGSGTIEMRRNVSFRDGPWWYELDELLDAWEIESLALEEAQRGRSAAKTQAAKDAADAHYASVLAMFTVDGGVDNGGVANGARRPRACVDETRRLTNGGGTMPHYQKVETKGANAAEALRRLAVDPSTTEHERQAAREALGRMEGGGHE